MTDKIAEFLAAQREYADFLSALPAGFHNDPADHNAAINITDFHGILIVHQWDKRGPDSDYWYELVHFELDGEEHSYNSLDEARDAIAEMIDAAQDHAPSTGNSHGSHSKPFQAFRSQACCAYQKARC